MSVQVRWGRDWTQGLVPVLVGIVVVWAVFGPAAWALARSRRRRAAAAAGSADDRTDTVPA